MDRASRLTLCTILALMTWTVVPAGAMAKSGDDIATSLYMLEPQLQRELIPLNARTLADANDVFYPIRIAPFGLSPSLGQHAIVVSPDGSRLAVVTEDCAGCRPPVQAKYSTVRIFNARTDVQLATFHPRVPISLSDPMGLEGTRLSGFRATWGAVSPRRWYTLNARGRVVSTTLVPSCCDPALYDPVGKRLYTTVSVDSQHLELLAYDTRSGGLMDQLTLTLPPAQTVEHLQAGQPVLDVSGPSMALSPDGRTLAVLDSRDNSLTMIDALSLKIASTRTVAPPSSAWERLGALLGLIPDTAYAKGLLVGAQLSIQFSRDGRFLYVTGSQGSIDQKGQYSWHGIGVERINLTTGELVDRALDGLAVDWLGEAADGSALYALTAKVPPNSGYSGPYTLYRLDAASLQVTAQRTFQDWPQLYILGGH